MGAKASESESLSSWWLVMYIVAIVRSLELAASCDEVERRENPDLTYTIIKNTQNDFYLKGVVRTQ